MPEAEYEQFDSGQLEHQNENITGKAAIPNCIHQQAPSRDGDVPRGPSDISPVKDRASHGFGEMPSLELTLKRLQGADSRNAANDDHNILRHSDLSAFSK